MDGYGKMRALLATARIANVPSVLSNLGVGVLLGFVGGGDFVWPWMVSVAAVMFYVCGNFLNDWADRDWDVVNRPERALPRGMFVAGLYLWIAILGMVGGLVICALAGLVCFVVGLVLCGLIVLYTMVHKKVAWSVIPMGMCRASLPVLGFAAVSGGMDVVVFFPAMALLFYVIGLSISARNEARGGVSAGEGLAARIMLFGAGVFAAVLPIIEDVRWGWLGLVPFVVWLVMCLLKFRSPVSVHVSALLAGIPFVDWVVLLPMGLVFLEIGGMDVKFLVAVCLAPVCVILGRVLQGVAPAT